MTVYLGRLYLSDNVVCMHITAYLPPGYVHVVNTKLLEFISWTKINF